MIPASVPDLARRARPLTMTVSMGPPQGVSDDDCGTAEMLVSHEVLPGIGRAHYAYFRPTQEELQTLQDGGFLELALYGSGVQPFGLLVQGLVPVDTIATSEHARQVGIDAWLDDARRLIAAERRRQVEVEGHTPDHDRAHPSMELLGAARAYWKSGAEPRTDSSEPPGSWPWAPSEWKPKDPISDLTRAGALLMAELDLHRLNPTEEEGARADLETIVCDLALAMSAPPPQRAQP